MLSPWLKGYWTVLGRARKIVQWLWQDLLDKSWAQNRFSYLFTIHLLFYLCIIYLLLSMLLLMNSHF